MGRKTTEKFYKKLDIAAEIRKQYLMEHLQHIEILISDWVKQLAAPEPFFPRDIFGWESQYCPPLEQDPDSSHQLHRHVRSRTLWMHHAEWERKLNRVWSLVVQLRGKCMQQTTLENTMEAEQNRGNYIETALLSAFDGVKANKAVDVTYRIGNGGTGVTVGAYSINTKATNEEERRVVSKTHQALAKLMAEDEDMKLLLEYWRELKSREESMINLARKILISRDILYPCRFCRHLWK